MRALVAAILLGLLVTPGASLAQSVQLDAILPRLLSKDTTDRRDAREDLEAYLNGLDEARRTAEVSELVARMTDPDYRIQLGVAIALSQLRTPWESRDLPGDTAKIYEMLGNSKDPTLAKYLDDTLANAKGLYFDAISDYNNLDERDNSSAEIVDETRQKFLKMAAFTRSAYAENAQFYLGQYFARLAVVFGRNDPVLRERYIDESNKWFDIYVERTRKGVFQSQNFLLDGQFYRALNELISGTPNEAVRRLNEIDRKADTLIYVYQFFFSRDRASAVNRFLEPDPLIKITLEFVKQYGSRLPDNQEALVKAVDRITASKF